MSSEDTTTPEFRPAPLPPVPDGLYDPAFERDACGVGFVAHARGAKSHGIVASAVLLLKNLQHRGACGCDQDTGDGAGILLQMPDAFFREESHRFGVALPPAGAYGVAFCFLPLEPDDRAECRRAVERFVTDQRQRVLGWRSVPVVSTAIGWLARSREPVMEQLFIGRGDKTPDAAAFERALYVIRRRAEVWATKGGRTAAGADFYIASCSARTIVYKGMLKADQLGPYFPDLADPRVESAIALVHSRYSTNTFPKWSLAQPFNMLAHNGEINTLRGNTTWLLARQHQMRSPGLGDDLMKTLPMDFEGLSDSAVLDRALELLVHSGRTLPQALMMLVPEAYETQKDIDPAVRGFFEYHRCLTEPWDGPAGLAFSDGTLVGAALDRNGLRPGRYVVTHDDLVVCGSEAGAIPIEPARVKAMGRLQPGKFFLIDTAAGRIYTDAEVKAEAAGRKPYADWVRANLVTLADAPAAATPEHNLATLRHRQQAFGYSVEDLTRVLLPIAQDGQEPVSSMGTDIPLAVLSDRPQVLFNYFRQLFAQVTNPPIDPIREKIVMNTESLVGAEVNLLDETPEHARLLRLKSPMLADDELARVRELSRPGLKAHTIPTLFPRAEGEAGLATALTWICSEAVEAVNRGTTVLILSDRGVDAANVPVPILLATAAVHHHLLRVGLRTKCGLVVETGEAKEVHHFALLLGYGAAAVNPYLVFETFHGLAAVNLLVDANGNKIEHDQAVKNYRKAIDSGLLKVFSKMGISTLMSYRGAQIFEAIGLNKAVVDQFFAGTPSRIEGIGVAEIARESLARHTLGFPADPRDESPELDTGGEIMWRRRGEHHMWNPDTVQKLQHAVNSESYATYKAFAKASNDESRKLCTLRGLLDVKKARKPIPPELVEPAKEIVKRFFTGAMSFGSISKEAHETLAIALNRVGGRSNTGEGGEDPVRFKRDGNGDLRGSAIKQVASGRFGVTANYLANAVEIQIKMAQGAKPGEGGQLPGHKVDSAIAKTRYSTPGVGLISPPPHHDIYSIEDLAQLIFDLRNSNPHAEISVKLVAAAGVGTIAAGVTKGYADRILISGDSGGTGASPLSSIRHAGVPWELGLAETQQVLVRNGLRGRVRVQTDGQMKTGRDVIVAACLGAEEYGFATAPLIAMGCIMMRKCHLNTCPVGIATQDPVLRAQFAGTPEQVVNYLFFVAEEVRELLSEMGFRTLDEIVGRPDLLEARDLSGHWKAQHLNLAALLEKPAVAPGTPLRCVERQSDVLAEQLDWELIRQSKPALEHLEHVSLTHEVTNRNRTIGTLLSYFVTNKHGESGLPEDTITAQFTGTAGQSFGAFVTKGITLSLKGVANDYVGKGLSGGKLIVAPPADASYVAQDNAVIGNVALYGATSGEAYFRGRAGERFAVRNSGAKAVVEGVGDHACEYMTGGVVVVLGSTGRNFAAGMSGGFAYVYDPAGTFREQCNTEMVDLVPVDEYKDIGVLGNLLNRHVLYTGSEVADAIVNDFAAELVNFVKVFPKDYRRVLEQSRAIQRQWELVNG
ncbi:glutamate synthase : Glutamate synthase (NADH) large subunit OS=Chthonomonas calidirosea (strain DSM 23976 / ICMP 18418 / T49) GN=CCALI_01654 PE=4 SV=1: GATase_2: Glu_syn_central: Glu_synthase: GXGXG [Gemmataceae bacterium]|nr:glutamate synthase : Glutamate synthase (NADH) large subunit OS=Chthonomonas calidirosea (strain DSM 23976 / ICMP 18418 / T49) GN=CCALI_01654 PE=4 SV=1: GATase_2: Glu_syn_central: Glu_synthase: GXGXG [Gemmataceae bacterium]VTT99849.1 glutamate synthase : Glutamate synthase (NADH) large subunit OS=Chthonomonas calidirosea (strain DSM 23976 / ICMP 18418 / T49) GN=CCALI_01654 PE=4 SV=1: GATase_2: Glu_syn_central: Glu_synthase: GXGXG [Gemmataceae bacterium]